LRVLGRGKKKEKKKRKEREREREREREKERKREKEKKDTRVKIHKNIPLGNKRFRLNVNKIYAIFCTTFALLLNNIGECT